MSPLLHVLTARKLPETSRTVGLLLNRSSLKVRNGFEVCFNMPISRRLLKHPNLNVQYFENSELSPMQSEV